MQKTVSQNMSEEIGHTQTAMPLHTNNSIEEGTVSINILPKLSKYMDMRFYWLHDWENQKQFQVYWTPGLQNKGYYHTKHHQAAYHRAVRDI